MRDYLAAVLPGLADCLIQRLPELTPQRWQRGGAEFNHLFTSIEIADQELRDVPPARFLYGSNSGPRGTSMDTCRLQGSDSLS